MANLFSELKRRNVFRVALAYIVVGWLLLQVADVVLNNIKSPDWVFQAILLVVVLGFGLAIIFAWAYELTLEGIKKEKDIDRSESITHVTGRKLDFVIIGVLVLTLAYFAYDKFVTDPDSGETPVASSNEVTETDIPELSIAVLPFVNMSSDPEQEFFSDGISEELLNMLAKFPGLRVAARTSSFQFKGQNLDIGKIAATLNVAHVLEGSVRKAGTRLRITAQLIKADSGYHLWSETYDRELDDIFAVQDEIAGAISEALKIKLALDSATSGKQPVSIQAANTEAYESYLHGRQLIHRRGRASLEEAVQLLERSLRLDNNFAPAHAQLAIATRLLLESPGSYGDLSLEQVKRIAIPHLDRALELEPNLAEGFAGRAIMSFATNDHLTAIEYARKALDVNPSYIDAMNWLYLALGNLGRYREQDEVMQQLLATDPLTFIGRSNHIARLGLQGRSDEGHRVAEELLETNPWNGYSRHAEMYLIHESNFAEGVSYALRAYELEPTDIFSNNFLVLALAWIGEYDEARRITDALDPMVDTMQGRHDDAIAATQRKLMFDPDNESTIVGAADALYLAGQIEKSRPFYDQLRDLQSAARPINSSTATTMRYAEVLRRMGDDNDAQEASRVAKQDHAMQIDAGQVNQYIAQDEAMFAAFDHDPDGVVTAIGKSLKMGLRDPGFFHDPIFDDMQDDPRFVALMQELDGLLAGHREEVLQTICFNNPVPNAWRPLPETCANLVRQAL